MSVESFVGLEPVGLWGNPSSSVDWCELNYVVCSFIAEFWNTISSLIISVFGAIGLYFVLREKWEHRFVVLYFLIIVIGLGSAVFHGTLHIEGQLLDELPMLWGSLCWIYVFLFIDEKSEITDTKKRIVVGLTTFGTLWTLASPHIHFHYPLAWQVLFSSMSLYFLYSLIRQYNTSPDPMVKAMLVTYVCSTLLASTLWLLDKHLCDQIYLLIGHFWWYPYIGSLHGYWHTLMAIGCYVGPIYVCALRAHILGIPFSIELWGGLVPYVKRLESPKSNKKL